MALCSKCGSPSFHPRISIQTDEVLQQLRSSVGFQDQAVVKPLLRDAEKDLVDYDTEIAQLEMAISVVKHKRTRLERYIANCRSLLSPIRRLPPEILTLVFLCLCRDQIIGYDTVDFDIVLPAFELSRVCASWREVALNTPAIWSNVLFDLREEFSTQQKINLSESFIRLCLERSAQVPLNLTLSPDFDIEMDNDRYAIFDAVLRPTSHRWRSLTISSYTEDIATLWSEITDLSTLEYLETDVETLGLSLKSSSALCQASHLRSLSLSAACTGLDFTPPPQTFPWAQISTLELSYMPWGCYFSILRQCPHITKFFVFQPDGPFSHEGIDTITLDRLNHWEFHCHSVEALDSNFFSMMTVPALKHLSISMSIPFAKHILGCKKSEPCWPLDIFSRFAARSSCTLTSFCIDSPIVESDFLSLLHLFPDLMELDIREPWSNPFPSKVITDGFLNGLHTTRLISDPFEDQSPIPCLRRLLHLSLRVCGPTFTPQTLIEMVKSRWIPDPVYSSQVGIACLRSIKVIGDQRAAKEPLAYKPLMELERFGLRVEIL